MAHARAAGCPGCELAPTDEFGVADRHQGGDRVRADRLAHRARAARHGAVVHRRPRPPVLGADRAGCRPAAAARAAAPPPPTALRLTGAAAGPRDGTAAGTARTCGVGPPGAATWRSCTASTCAVPAGQTVGRRRRERLRQVADDARGAWGCSPAPLARPRRRGPLRRTDLTGLRRARPAGDPRRRPGDDLPGPDDLAEPADARRRPGDRGDDRARRGEGRRRAAGSLELLAQVGHPRPGAHRARRTRTSSPAACASGS